MMYFVLKWVKIIFYQKYCNFHGFENDKKMFQLKYNSSFFQIFMEK